MSYAELVHISMSMGPLGGGGQEREDESEEAVGGWVGVRFHVLKIRRS